MSSLPSSISSQPLYRGAGIVSRTSTASQSRAFVKGCTRVGNRSKSREWQRFSRNERGRENESLWSDGKTSRLEGVVVKGREGQGKESVKPQAGARGESTAGTFSWNNTTQLPGKRPTVLQCARKGAVSQGATTSRVEPHLFSSLFFVYGHISVQESLDFFQAARHSTLPPLSTSYT